MDQLDDDQDKLHVQKDSGQASNGQMEPGQDSNDEKEAEDSSSDEKELDDVSDDDDDDDKKSEVSDDDDKEPAVSNAKKQPEVASNDEEEPDEVSNDKREPDEASSSEKEREGVSDEGEDDEDDDKEHEASDEEKEPAASNDEKEPEEASSDEASVREDEKPVPVYDFDIMMAKKKEENSRKRKRRNYDIINDNDDIIADIINQMRDAVEADVEANKNHQAATRKLKLLPFVISQLRKIDLRDAFLDSDVLSVITEWLAPLPDRSLPHLNIRENLLKILIDFNLYDVDRIKGSGIGKAVMYLYKHPKETRENKQRAKQLISSWSRPIFNLETSFNSISREDREERDLELMKKQRRASGHDSSYGDEPGPSSAAKKPKDAEPVAQKPGEKGWIPRARVPAPSMKDYVIRPRSKVDGDIGRGSKRPTNMLEKLMKTHQERRRASKQQRAVNMKVDRV